MKLDGRLPKPVYLPNCKRPLWLESELDATDKRATRERVPSKQISAA
jgi:hypothetical protein